jgi:hypothetical protein
MQVGVMTTNGGPHPADKWALTTTGQIMQAVFSKPAAETAGARKFEIALLDILAPHHEHVQKHERGKIEEHGITRLSHPIDPREHCAAVVADIAAAALKAGSVVVPDPDRPGETITVDLGAHFAKPEVQAALAGLIGSHFASAMDIERSWHADRNAHHDEAKAYHKARNEHGAALVHAHIHKYRPGHAA